MEVGKKVVFDSSAMGHELYWYRVDRVKHNLQIEVDNPLIE